MVLAFTYSVFKTLKMGNFLRFIVLFTLTFSVRGKVSKASYLSNKRDVTNICTESAITEVSCAGTDELGLMPHPDDCRLFYQCAYGVPFCQRCPPGLHFNPSLLVCDAPKQAGCVAQPETEFDVSHIEKNEESTAPAASGNEIPARCIANSVTRVSCAETESPDALLAHPDDCNLFYYCVSAASAPVCRQCPADLHFNPELHVCDQPEDAGCQAKDTKMNPAFRVLVANSK